MSPKTIVMVTFSIGSIIGSYLPILFGVNTFSYTTLITGALGGTLGIYIGYKLIS